MSASRVRTSKWTVAALAGLAAATSACGLFASADAEALSSQAVTILETLEAEPYGGDRFEVTETDVKLDAVYVSSQGINPQPPEPTIDELEEVLTAHGFEVTANRQVEFSLGHELVATDGRQVVRSILGPGDEDTAAYPPLEDATYVVILVANANSGPDWADLNS